MKQRVLACLGSVADLSVGPQVAASPEWRTTRWRSFAWELLAAPDLIQVVCARIRTFRYENGQRVERPYSPGRINLTQVAIRRMLHYCVLVGLVSPDQVRLACDEIPRAPSKRRTGTYLTPRQVASLVTEHAPGSHPVTVARDAAIVMLLAGTGMRRHELVALTFDRLDLKHRKVDMVVTKGGVPRVAYLKPEVVDALQRWIKLGRPKRQGPVFVPLTKSGRVTAERPLSAHQVWKILKARGCLAKVPARLSPHDLRHYAICQMIDAGVDLPTVKDAIGHRRIETTVGYDNRPTSRVRKAVNTIGGQPGAARGSADDRGRQRRVEKTSLRGSRRGGASERGAPGEPASTTTLRGGTRSQRVGRRAQAHHSSYLSVWRPTTPSRPPLACWQSTGTSLWTRHGVSWGRPSTRPATSRWPAAGLSSVSTPLSTCRRTRALAALWEGLTAAEVPYPGTDPILRYRSRTLLASHERRHHVQSP